jgi:hypothetical protein
MHIQTSFKSLTRSEYDLLTSKFKNYKTYFSTKKIESEYLTQVKENIVRNDIKPDLTLNEIHFNNGYINLITNTFQQREVNKHFVSLTIERDYKTSSVEQEETLLKYIKQIYPKEDVMNCILTILGCALTGHAPKQQIVLFLIGLGSTGKSFILSLTKRALTIYLKELKYDTFTQNNPDINKILNSYDKEPTPRISWINEMEDKRVDSEIFKAFPEGQIETTKLYKEGSHTVIHHSLLISTSNNTVNIKIDSGTSRRMKSLQHESLFVEDIKFVDEANHKYLKNKDLLDDIENNNLLNAWITILCKYASQWNETKVIPYTTEFINSANEIKDANDIFQDFLDAKLVITDNENDKIHKDEMESAFKQMYPLKRLSANQLRDSIKDKSIKYNYNLRKSGFETRGCYTGVKFKQTHDIPDICLVDTLQSENNEKDLMIEKLKREINDREFLYKLLQDENEKLKKQIEAKSHPITEYYPPTQSELSSEEINVFRNIRKNKKN